MDSVMNTLRWVFSEASLMWWIIEVIITSFVVCVMVRNIETWSDKFKEKHRIPWFLVLLVTAISSVLCCVIDFLWNLWSLYDKNGGSLDELSRFAKGLCNSRIYVYSLLIAAVFIICGIYFVCLKAYRISGIVLIILGLAGAGLIVYLATEAFVDAVHRIMLFRMRLPRINDLPRLHTPRLGWRHRYG